MWQVNKRYAPLCTMVLRMNEVRTTGLSSLLRKKAGFPSQAAPLSPFNNRPISET